MLNIKLIESQTLTADTEYGPYEVRIANEGAEGEFTFEVISAVALSINVKGSCSNSTPKDIDGYDVIISHDAGSSKIYWPELPPVSRLFFYVTPEVTGLVSININIW